LIARAVIELGRPRRFVCGNLLSMLERAAILQIGCNAGRAEGMAAGGVGEAGLLRPTLDHPQHVIGIHPVLGQPVALTNAGKQPTFLVGCYAGGAEPYPTQNDKRRGRGAGCSIS
jgi:hypothetical protein